MGSKSSYESGDFGEEEKQKDLNLLNDCIFSFSKVSKQFDEPTTVVPL